MVVEWVTLAVALAAGFGGAFLLGRVTKPPVEVEIAVEPVCAHDWEVRGVEHWGTWPPGAKERRWGNHTGAWTKCLWACRRCKARDVVRYNGKWTVEQLGRRRQKQEGFASPWEDYETK